VYIDAAYDHVQASKWEQALEPFFAAAPTPTAQDFASATNLQAFLASVRGVVFPIGEVLAITNFDSSGVARGQRTPARISQLLTSAAQPLDYSRVRAPALSLYSEWESAADVLPFLGRDPAATARATAALQPVRAAQEVERARFAHEVKGGRVVILHAHHYQFLSHPQELERQMRDFLKSAQVSVRTARLSSSEG
jgi:pimeloyl-ACP methyl ester carboxylesterase